MAKNVLPKIPSAPSNKSTSPAKSNPKRFSALAIFFMILLTIVLVILGERLMIDLNDWFNPASSSNNPISISPNNYYDEYSYDQYYQPQKAYSESDYQMYRLLVHGAFVIPVLLAGFLLYFWMYYRMKDNPKRLIVWPYFLFSIWMTIHLIGEAFYFLMNKYEKVGFYIVLLVLAGLFTWLGLFIQKKWHEKHIGNNIRNKERK